MSGGLAPMAIRVCGEELWLGRLVVISRSFDGGAAHTALQGDVCPVHDGDWPPPGVAAGRCLVTYVRTVPGVRPERLQERLAQAAQQEIEASTAPTGELVWPETLANRIAAAMLRVLGMRRDMS